jgi:hypothetical protein
MAFRQVFIADLVVIVVVVVAPFSRRKARKLLLMTLAYLLLDLVSLVAWACKGKIIYIIS